MNDTIAAVIQLPRKFRETGNRSMHSLLGETGYFENYNDVSESAIREALRPTPEHLNEWILLSENKRNSAGLYFRRGETGNYVVAYFTVDTSEVKKLLYTDPIEACAAFIKREIEDIRGL